jgi:hypothetical protein
MTAAVERDVFSYYFFSFFFDVSQYAETRAAGRAARYTARANRANAPP